MSNIECRMSNVEVRKEYLQHQDCETEDPMIISSLRHSTFDIRYSTFSLSSLIIPSSLRHSTFDIRYSTFSLSSASGPLTLVAAVAALG